MSSDGSHFGVSVYEGSRPGAECQPKGGSAHDHPAGCSWVSPLSPKTLLVNCYGIIKLTEVGWATCEGEAYVGLVLQNYAGVCDIHIIIMYIYICTMMKPHFKGKTTSTKPMYSRKLIHPRVYDNTPQLHRKA